MDFGALPPEINSARMWAGAGAGPLLAAAASWQALAADLRGTAAGYRAVVAGMQAVWLGPSSNAMAASAAGYATWLTTTAAQAEQTAGQAAAAAAAYEAAFVATVPPPVIATNRAQLAALVATNILGQNTPAIMATEALYVEMWAQDAAAMYAYQANSAAATSALPTFAPAPQTTNPAAAISGATTASSSSSSIIDWINSILDGSSPYSPLILNTWYSLVSGSSLGSAPTNIMSLFTGLWLGAAATQAFSGGTANAVANPGIAQLLAPTNYPPVTASIGGAGTSAAGGLSVPPSWAKWLAPDVSINTPAGAAPAAAEDVPGLIMPPIAVPAGAGKGRDDPAASRPKYLHRPRMLPGTPVN